MATEIQLYQGAYSGSEIDAAIAAAATHEADTSVHISQAQATAITNATSHIADDDIHLSSAQASAIASAVQPSDIADFISTVPGTALSTGANLFQLDPGVYTRASANTSVTNVPSGVTGAFYAVVVNTIADNRRRIYLFPTATNENHTFYIATELGSGYRDWRKFTADDGTLDAIAVALSEQGKNLLKTLHASTVDHGVQIELMPDGSYKLNGTATGGFSLKATATFADIPAAFVGQKVTLSGGVSGSVCLRVYGSTSSTTKLYEDTGEGVEITLTAEMLSAPYDIRIFVANTTVCEDVIVKPMLRASGTATFKPYEPTSRALYEQTAAIDTKLMNGKVYWALGDSIVERQGTKGNLSEYYNDSALYGYIPRIEETFGLTAVNKGNGGHWLAQDIDALLALDYSGVDLITIAYGTNDGKQAKPIGTVDSSDTTTYAGAMNALLTKIYTDNPMCKVLVLTPLQRNAQNDYGSFVPDANGKTLEDFANMAAAVAGRNATPCVDLFHKSGITAGNFSTVLYDGLHPKNAGYARIWNAMRSALIEMLTG